MADKKRFSEDFTHWNDAIPTAFRCMVEDPTTGEEYWVTREQFITGVTIGNMGGASAYDIYKGTTSDIPVLSEIDWINSLKGHDGITPTIGSNGNWFIGAEDTGIKAQPENPIPQAQIFNAPMGAVLFYVGLLSSLSDTWHLANGDTVEGFGKTIDMRGKVPMGYDPDTFAEPKVAAGLVKNYGAIGNTGGQSFITLTKSQIPALKVTLPGQRGGDNNDNSNITAFAGGDKGQNETGFNFTIDVNTEGSGQEHENRMEYVVGAYIQRVKPEVLSGGVGKSAYQSYLDTTADDPKKTEAEWVAALKGDKGDKGIDGIIGSNGQDGTSVPVNISIFKTGANGITLPQKFKWINDITVTSVELMDNCSGISVTIGANTYNQITLVGVTIPAGTQLIMNDLTIVAGETNANAIIIC